MSAPSVKSYLSRLCAFSVKVADLSGLVIVVHNENGEQFAMTPATARQLAVDLNYAAGLVAPQDARYVCSECHGGFGNHLPSCSVQS